MPQFILQSDNGFMGITTQSVKFLFHARRLGVSYSETVMLGRQELYADASWINHYREGKIGETEPFQAQAGKYAESFFKWMGARTIESLDYSDYEQATLIHDLNSPVPDALKNRFTTVFDGGTLEHVFNFPTAIKSCMEMVTVGGHFVSITPANNQMGHGFYQFSPELYFSLFSAQSGFEVTVIWLAVELSASNWVVYDVTNPGSIGERVVLANGNPTHLMVIAKKNVHVTLPPAIYQSDYQSMWKVSKEETGTMKSMYRKLIPKSVRDIIWKIRFQNVNRTKLRGLGNVSSRHFKEIEF